MLHQSFEFLAVLAVTSAVCYAWGRFARFNRPYIRILPLVAITFLIRESTDLVLAITRMESQHDGIIFVLLAVPMLCFFGPLMSWGRGLDVANGHQTWHGL